MELTLTYMFSQFFTILIYVFLAITYYAKDKKIILLFSFFSLIANALAYVLLSAWTGFFMCIVAMIRNIIFIIDEKKNSKKERIDKKDILILLILYIILIIFVLLTFDGIASICSALATVIYTYSVWQNKTKVYKLLGIPYGIFCILYNILIHSIFGIILEIILLICSTTGYILEIKN